MESGVSLEAVLQKSLCLRNPPGRLSSCQVETRRSVRCCRPNNVPPVRYVIGALEFRPERSAHTHLARYKYPPIPQFAETLIAAMGQFTSQLKFRSRLPRISSCTFEKLAKSAKITQVATPVDDDSGCREILVVLYICICKMCGYQQE